MHNVHFPSYPQVVSAVVAATEDCCTATFQFLANVAISTVLTPIAIPIGLLSLPIILADTIFGSIQNKNIHQQQIDPNIALQVSQKGSFIDQQVRLAKIAALKIIPFVGSFLAEHFATFGSLQKIALSPLGLPINSLLPTSVLNSIYGDRRRLRQKWTNLPPRLSRKNLEYLRKKEPSFEETKDLLSSVTVQSRIQVVRIPVGGTIDAPIRYHDAMVYFAKQENPNIQNKTVLLYHGNSDVMEQQSLNITIPLYLKAGYNVIASSYAGDPSLVVQSHLPEYLPLYPGCTEAKLQEDAAADVRFLTQLGVSELSVHGYSLGGAQALNAVDEIRKNNNLCRVFFVILDKTFTSGPDVAQKYVERNPFVKKIGLGSVVSRGIEHLFKREQEETGIARGDALHNLEKIKEINKNNTFSLTKFAVIGGRCDEIMGKDKENFAHILFHECPRERSYLIEEKSDHITPLSIRHAIPQLVQFLGLKENFYENQECYAAFIHEKQCYYRLLHDKGPYRMQMAEYSAMSPLCIQKYMSSSLC